MITTTECFELLRLKPGAFVTQVRQAFKTMAVKNNPDKCPEADRVKATEKMVKLNEAHKKLIEHIENPRVYIPLSPLSPMRYNPNYNTNPFGTPLPWPTRFNRRSTHNGASPFPPAYQSPEDHVPSPQNEPEPKASPPTPPKASLFDSYPRSSGASYTRAPPPALPAMHDMFVNGKEIRDWFVTFHNTESYSLHSGRFWTMIANESTYSGLPTTNLFACSRLAAILDEAYDIAGKRSTQHPKSPTRSVPSMNSTFSKRSSSSRDGLLV